MKRSLPFFYSVAFACLATAYASAQDKFADIGTRKYDNRRHLLTEPQPPVLPDVQLPTTHNKHSVFQTVKTTATKNELYVELAKLKHQYQPFLKNEAPAPKATRQKIPLKEFNWRIETLQDLQNFTATQNGEGEWKKVAIPHYGPPLGRAVTYYYKEIEIAASAITGRDLLIVFKGVDYKASVFLNGRYVGSHEGFFAPFEFNVSGVAKAGKNQLLVKVENDFSTLGGKDKKGNHVIGEKIYAASGLGYDDPEEGWHHCPPAMGIYQECYLESRAPIHLNDIYIRPLPKDSVAEAWVEVNNFNEYPENVRLNIAIYGQNFKETTVENMAYSPSTTYIPGVGDLAKPNDWAESTLKMGYGANLLRIPIKIKNFRAWQPDSPWLYQIQISVIDSANNVLDTRTRQFGMRSFSIDTVNTPKGYLYLNGEKIRLRGANSMGFEQQDVFKGDTAQLINDMLLAKLCNMNFIRFTQRPVQSEVYEMCDKLGMLNQTDLPLFGALRHTQFAEAVKQAGEMERLVRNHPSAIMVTYINERFPNAEGSPQRSFSDAEEYYKLFAALDQAVLLNNPDRVIKAGDGDYDPPSPGLPDNHCYNTWYNGHGLGLGKMYKGYWQLVKPDWNYACGEFGAEGLDPFDVMKKYYPKSWLPSSTEDEKQWTANRISKSQTHRFHYMWYNTQHSLTNWIEASQNYQAWAIKFVTETFRRDPRMVSFAVHLFIDAWPAGWMKTIMDVDRQPKKAYFAYRNALQPLLVTVRSDRNKFFSGEKTALELWISNDKNQAPAGHTLRYQIEQNGKAIWANQVPANIPVNSARFQGFLKFNTPGDVHKRTTYVFRAAIFNENGKSVSQNEFEFEVFPSIQTPTIKLYVAGTKEGVAQKLVQQAGMVPTTDKQMADIILIDDFEAYRSNSKEYDTWVRQGKKIVFLELAAGKYTIGGTGVNVEKTSMGDYYFVSPTTGHSLVKSFQPFDFFLWNHEVEHCIMPIMPHTFSAADWEPVLTSGKSNWLSDSGVVMAAGQLKQGKGAFRICEVQLADRLKTNPVAKEWFFKLISE